MLKNDKNPDLISQINDLKLELERLKKEQVSTSLYKEILSTTSDFMAFIDENFVYQSVNSLYVEAQKIPIEKIIGSSVVDFWGEEIFNDVIKLPLEKALAGKKNKYSAWFPFKNNEKRFLEVTYFPYKDFKKKIKGVVVRGRDITRQKQAERALKESEQKFKALDENRLLGFAVVRQNPIKFVFANRTMANLTGYRVKDLKEFSFSQIKNLIHKEDRKNFLEIYSDLLTGKIESNSQTFRGINKSGKIYWAEAFANNIEYKGSPALLIAFKDISERISAQKKVDKFVKQIKKSKEREEQKATELASLYQKISDREQQLKKENADKDKFFSIISHDLRSPFTALLGYAQLLEDDFEKFNNEELKMAIESMSKISRNIFTLIEGLLEWSRSATGKIDFMPVKFDLFDTVNTVKLITNDIAQKKEIIVNNNISEGNLVFADVKMVDTILRNLVTNAIKFTHNNGIINISVKDNIENMQVTVTDNGIGMTEETIQKLFKINFHHTTVGTNNEIGTGLGLIIAKEFVEKNGGNIWVESNINMGSSFNFTLPKKQ